jgi:hypothetical protein
LKHFTFEIAQSINVEAAAEEDTDNIGCNKIKT